MQKDSRHIQQCSFLISLAHFHINTLLFPIFISLNVSANQTKSSSFKIAFFFTLSRIYLVSLFSPIVSIILVQMLILTKNILVIFMTTLKRYAVQYELD